MPVALRGVSSALSSALAIHPEISVRVLRDRAYEECAGIAAREAQLRPALWIIPGLWDMKS